MISDKDDIFIFKTKQASESNEEAASHTDDMDVITTGMKVVDVVAAACGPVSAALNGQ